VKGKVLLIVLSLTLGSGVAASAAVRLQAHNLCGSHCGTVGAVHGDGTLRQTGTGVTYGTVGSGQIAILDRSNNGSRDYSVGGWDKRWSHDGWVYFRGNGLSYRVWTSWTVKIHGSWGISSNTTATGWGFIQGSGQWSLNGAGGATTSKWPKWPSAGKSFTITT
jgi:hypothetical protein